MHCCWLLLLCCGAGLRAQDINFGDSSGSSQNNQQDSQDPDQKFFGIIPGLSSGNSNTDSLLNGAILGGGGVLGVQALQGALGGGCGRRRRQSDDGSADSKFFGLGGGNNCFNPCGRKRRQAEEGNNDPNNKFLNFGGSRPCGGGFNNGGFNNGGFNNGGFNNGFNNGGFNNNNGFNNGGFNNGGFSNGGFNNGGFNNGFNNPCGRKKRQLNVGEGDQTQGGEQAQGGEGGEGGEDGVNTRRFNNNRPCGGGGSFFG